MSKSSQKPVGKPAKPSKAKRSPKPAVEALERSPSHLLHRALQLALDLYAGESAGSGLTQRQYALLAAVDTHEQPSQTDLVRSTGIDRSTLADLVARMTAKGWLARERSTLDARANVVRLTEAGRGELDGARPRAAAADTRILAALGAGKRDAFVAALQKLARAGEATLLTEVAEPARIGAAKPKKIKKAAKPKKSKKAKPKAAAEPAEPEAAA